MGIGGIWIIFPVDNEFLCLNKTGIDSRLVRLTLSPCLRKYSYHILPSASLEIIMASAIFVSF